MKTEGKTKKVGEEKIPPVHLVCSCVCVWLIRKKMLPKKILGAEEEGEVWGGSLCCSGKCKVRRTYRRPTLRLRRNQVRTFKLWKVKTAKNLVAVDFGTRFSVVPRTQPFLAMEPVTDGPGVNKEEKYSATAQITLF